MKAPPKLKFRLYVAGDSPNSAQAKMNLERLCREHLPDRHHIDVIDVLSEPERAIKDKVLITPTLLKLEPRPVRTIIGNLGNSLVVLQALGLPPV
ncbi:MAG: circadian clock KaiB family protein [Opitutaceae bacterium]|nr:circadian clock KaiB family protein [Opitutaceae bacterium]